MANLDPTKIADFVYHYSQIITTAALQDHDGTVESQIAQIAVIGAMYELALEHLPEQFKSIVEGLKQELKTVPEGDLASILVSMLDQAAQGKN